MWPEISSVCWPVHVCVCVHVGQNQEGAGLADRQLSAKGHFQL